MNKLLILISVALLGSMFFLSCEKDTPTTTCTTDNMSYQNDVVPILTANCTGCHSEVDPAGDIPLVTYADVNTSAMGSLVASIKHSAGVSAMPKGKDKLSDCDISKIEAWVAQGALDN